jgi:hypothetical protein
METRLRSFVEGMLEADNMDWDRYFQKYFEISRDRIEDLVRAGEELERVLSSGGRLVGDEAYTFQKYILFKMLKSLEEASEPVPEIFYEVMQLYGVDIPLYIVPEKFLVVFFERDDDAVFLLDHSYSPPRELAIVLNRDFLERGLKNINKSRLRSLLFSIGKIVFKHEMRFFGETAEPYLRSKGYEGRELVEELALMIGVRLDKWVEGQYRKLKAYMNTRMDGWKRGLRFEDVLSTFNPEIERFRELFRPLSDAYTGPWPLKVEEKRRPIMFTELKLDKSDPHPSAGSADRDDRKGDTSRR